MLKILHNKRIIILLSTNSLVLFSAAMLGPIYALFVEDMGGDILSAGFAFGIYAFAAMITTFISGHFTDKVKEPELVMVLGYCFIGLGFVGYLFTGNLWQLLVDK